MITLKLFVCVRKIRVISPTRKELIMSLVEFISDATGLAFSQILRGKQNAPVPLGAYCTLLYVTDIPWGTPQVIIEENGQDSNLLDYKFKGKRKYNFSVQFYRDDATEYAKLLAMYFYTPWGQVYQQTASFSLNQVNVINETGTVISQNYEDRAMLSIDLIVFERQTITVNRVDIVPIHLVMDGNSLINYDGEIIR